MDEDEKRIFVVNTDDLGWRSIPESVRTIIVAAAYLIIGFALLTLFGFLAFVIPFIFK